MHILMFGWEFPPIYSGGLGTACAGIAEWLLSNGHQIYFVLPHTAENLRMEANHPVKFLPGFASESSFKPFQVQSGLSSPYLTAETYINWLEAKRKESPQQNYGTNLMEEVQRYALEAAEHAREIPHDIIHSHDWLTAHAGVEAQKISGQPHVLHIHATEFDRAGENPNQAIYDLERQGMEKSDHIIAVSDYTKKMIIKHYWIAPDKIDVVHNAVKPNVSFYQKAHHLNKTDAIVLFLGRMTMQKGPDYFLQMAKKVLDHRKRVKFIMAGDGDMTEKMIHLATDLGIERNILFTGFLKGKEVARAYSTADLYVMPSVSEPFGITPLEAIMQGAPVLISKQSGVSEVIKNALRVDFWDIDEMASKVLAVLDYHALWQTLREHGAHEVKKLHWHGQAKKITKVYEKAMAKKLKIKN